MSTFRNRLRKQTLVLAIAGAVGVACSAYAALPASNAQFATLTRATQLSRGDVVNGAMPLSQQIHISVALKLRNPAQLAAFNAQPHAPISQAQLTANHLPTQVQAQAVANFLTQAGFKNVKISSNRMLVDATGSAAIASRAFQTSLAQVRTRDGRTAFANNSEIKIPAALRGIVQAVLGLQTVHQAHFYAQRVQAGSGGISGHSPTEFASIYGASGLNPASNIDVAVFGWGSMSQTLTDLNTFTTAKSLPTVTTAVVCTNVGDTTDPTTGKIIDPGVTTIGDPTCQNVDQGSIEWNLDSQDIIGMTHDVHSMTFYAAPSGNNFEINSALNEIVTPTQGEPRASVVNQSFGECERFEDSNQGGDGTAQAGDNLYAMGVAQGQTFSASTGDSGSDECGDGGLNSASYPASSPYNVAVAGTTLNASSTTFRRETVWNGSGGSPSSFETVPSWQSSFTYGPFKAFRGTADVAFDANPNTGAIYYLHGSLVQVGGTSLASPIFVGAWARLLANRAVSSLAAGPQLYAFPASDFRDVTGGNNHGYIAKRGYDYASGRGSLNLGKFPAGSGE
ncbi:MAG: S53 family serine peptidase [Rhodanobacteraceae bacterium]